MADEGQMIPEDPDCVDQLPVIQKIEGPSFEKRQKTSEALMEASTHDFG